MKRILFVLFLLCAFRVAAVDLITATVTVTNLLGTTNGQTITVNSDTRTWANTVTNTATQVATNFTDARAATNLFLHVAGNPFVGLTLTRGPGTNAIVLRGTPGGALVVTLSAAWGEVALSTNTLTPALAVRVPYTVESAANRTNVASGIVAAIGGTENTNSPYENATVFAHVVGRTNSQTVSGFKQFTGSVRLDTPAVVSPVITNGVNYGNAFSSVGTGSGAEQFGVSAAATAGGASALGSGAAASAQGSTAIGQDSVASGQNSAAVGAGATAAGISSVTIGGVANADGSSALGQNSLVDSTHTNSTAIGQGAITTAKNQVMLGTSDIDVYVNHNLNVGNAISGVNFANTNAFPAGSDVAFGRYALTSLAAGNNAAIPVGTNVFVEVSGPGSAFTINGIAGGRDGKFLVILNQTTFNMTIAHDSGTDPTAANRIYTMTGADRSTTGNGAAILIYSGSASRWILISLDP